MNFNWNPEKNQWLSENRNITFEEVILLIHEGYLLQVIKHPSKINQKIFIIEREGYVINVPFIEDKNGDCFLKTIYPSRASTKKYLGD